MKNIEKTIVTLENIQKTLVDVGYNKHDADYSELCDIITDLKFELASKNAKESGKTNINTVVKRVLKYSDKGTNLSKIQQDNGRNYVCDGHILLTLPEDFNIEGYEVSDNPLNCSKLAKHIEQLERHYKAIDLYEYGWNVKEIKSHIKTIKAKHGKDVKNLTFIIKVDCLEVAFNPNFLIDSMELTKSNFLHVGKRVEPMFMYGCNAEALFLPINLDLSHINDYVGFYAEYNN